MRIDLLTINVDDDGIIYLFLNTDNSLTRNAVHGIAGRRAVVDVYGVGVCASICGRINHNCRLFSGASRCECAVIEGTSKRISRAFNVAENGLALFGAVKSTVGECHILCTVGPDMIAVIILLLKNAVNEFNFVGIQKLQSLDSAILIGEFSGMLETLIILIGERNRYTIKTCGGCFVDAAFHINHGVLGSADGDALVFQRGECVGAGSSKINRDFLLSGGITDGIVQVVLRGCRCLNCPVDDECTGIFFAVIFVASNAVQCVQ